MNIFVQVRDHHHGVCGQQEPAPAAGGDSGQAAGARPAADGRQPRERGAGPLPRARRAAPGREARQRAGQQPGRLQARGLRLLRVRLGPQAGGGPQPGRHPGLPGILTTDECPHNLTRPPLHSRLQSFCAGVRPAQRATCTASACCCGSWRPGRSPSPASTPRPSCTRCTLHEQPHEHLITCVRWWPEGRGRTRPRPASSASTSPPSPASTAPAGTQHTQPGLARRSVTPVTVVHVS